jgi:hypothetical protein
MESGLVKDKTRKKRENVALCFSLPPLDPEKTEEKRGVGG